MSREPNRYLATIQLGITLAGFLASAAAAVSLASRWSGRWVSSAGRRDAAAVLLVTVVLTFVTLVLGELARSGWRCSGRRALGAAAGPAGSAGPVSRPAVWLLSRATDRVVRLAGGDPRASRGEVTEEELRELLVSQRGLSAQQREILAGAFDIAGRTLREILVARRDVTVVPASAPAAEAMRRLAAAGRSRAPVVGPGGLDDVCGVVHIRDLVDAGDTTAGQRARSPLLLPGTLAVADAMRQFRQRHEQLALVVDEHGGIDGLVTMEDLLEEVVGELYDETDRDVGAVVREPDGALLLPGDFPLHDLPDVGVRLTFPLPRDYTTVAGLVLARLGRVPDGPGESVRLPGLTVTVLEVADRAIRRVRLRGPAAGCRPE